MALESSPLPLIEEKKDPVSIFQQTVQASGRPRQFQACISTMARGRDHRVSHALRQNYSTGFYNELRKQSSGTLQNLFQGLWESRADPLTASSDGEVQRVWEKLDDAILEACQCALEITSRYGEQETVLYYHAAEVLFALEEVKRHIGGDRDPLLEAAMR